MSRQLRGALQSLCRQLQIYLQFYYAVGFRYSFSSIIPSFRVLPLILPSVMINHVWRPITFCLFIPYWFCPYQPWIKYECSSNPNPNFQCNSYPPTAIADGTPPTSDITRSKSHHYSTFVMLTRCWGSFGTLNVKCDLFSFLYLLRSKTNKSLKLEKAIQLFCVNCLCLTPQQHREKKISIN